MLVSTHQVDDLSDLFDTVVVIDKGALRFQGTVPDFLDLVPAATPRAAEAAYETLVSAES